MGKADNPSAESCRHTDSNILNQSSKYHENIASEFIVDMSLYKIFETMYSYAIFTNIFIL